MIGERVKLLRTQKGTTQRELAQFLGLTPKMISFYENGDRFPPHDILIKLANFFSCSVDYLLGRTNIKNNEFNPNEPEMLENHTLKEIENLSEESKKELEKYVKLLKIKDEMDKSKDETSSTLEKEA